MKIYGWQADTSACGFYRIEQPFSAMAAAGISAEARIELTGSEMIEADAVVVQRASTIEALEVMVLAREYGARFIYEVDDLLFHLDPANSVFGHYSQKYVQDVMRMAMQVCAGMTVSTEALAEEMRALVDYDVHVVPNCLPDYFELLGHGARGIMNAVDETAPARVLWAGSFTHAGDFVKEARYGLRRAIDWASADFTCMGGDYRRQLQTPDASYVSWSDGIPEFHASLVGYEVGLCPLALTRFNRSKSGLKAMEYQAAGIVPVASNCEAYRGVITDGVDGFLCGTQSQWKDALMTLATEPETRLRMRRAALRNTTERLVKNNASTWVEAYTSILGSRDSS